MDLLLGKIKACTICSEHLPHGPRPVLSVSPSSRILWIGQAPGRKVHNSGIAWNDASGKELRRWLGVSDEEFYNPDLIASLPMGFCYPGTGNSGDLPPRKECAPTWHEAVLKNMKEVQLTVLIGQYAQQQYLGRKRNLTEIVMNFESYLPQYLPLPHPSPRNRMWQRRNPWFEDAVVPYLQQKVRGILQV